MLVLNSLHEICYIFLHSILSWQGDEVISVNGVDVKGKSAFEVSSLLQGPNETFVTMEVVIQILHLYYLYLKLFSYFLSNLQNCNDDNRSNMAFVDPSNLLKSRDNLSLEAQFSIG